METSFSSRFEFFQSEAETEWTEINQDPILQRNRFRVASPKSSNLLRLNSNVTFLKPLLIASLWSKVAKLGPQWNLFYRIGTRTQPCNCLHWSGPSGTGFGCPPGKPRQSVSLAQRHRLQLTLKLPTDAQPSWRFAQCGRRKSASTERVGLAQVME